MTACHVNKPSLLTIKIPNTVSEVCKAVTSCTILTILSWGEGLVTFLNEVSVLEDINRLPKKIIILAHFLANSIAKKEKTVQMRNLLAATTAPLKLGYFFAILSIDCLAAR